MNSTGQLSFYCNYSVHGKTIDNFVGDCDIWYMKKLLSIPSIRFTSKNSFTIIVLIKEREEF